MILLIVCKFDQAAKSLSLEDIYFLMSIEIQSEVILEVSDILNEVGGVLGKMLVNLNHIAL